MSKDYKVLFCMIGAICLCFAGLTLAPVANAGSQSVTWDYDAAADYTFNPEVIEVVAADSVARLVELPADQFWIRRYLPAGGAPITNAAYTDCALDPDGNIVVVGYTDNAFGGTDMLITKYDQAGTMLAGWPLSVPYRRAGVGAGAQDNQAYRVHVDTGGNITVAGFSDDGTGANRDFAIWRTDATGTLLPGPPGWPVYLDATGVEDIAYGVTVDIDGNIVAAGFTTNAAPIRELTIAKYDPNGTPVGGAFPVYYNRGGSAAAGYDIMQDSDGNYVVVGYGIDPGGVTGWDGLLDKYGSIGNRLWTDPVFYDGGAAGALDDYMAISQDRNNDYCPVGYTTDAGGNANIIMNRYATDGTPITGWPAIDAKDGTTPVAPNIWRGYVDTASNIASAYDDASVGTLDAYTIKYEQNATAFTGFPKPYIGTGAADLVYGCAVDDLDNIYTMGASDDTAAPPNRDAFIIKYPPARRSTGRPSITNTAATAVTYTKIEGFEEVLGPNNEGSVAYQLSNDGTNWYYHDGTAWAAAADKYQANSAAEINYNCSTFATEVGVGDLSVRAFLVSDGTQQVELDSVTVRYDDARTWYLAEGSTGLDANGNFETWVLLQNPSTVATATATLTYQTPTGTVAGPVVALAPSTRQTVNVAATVPNEWSVSTTVTSDEPIICERAMYWMSAEGVYRQAAHDSIGVTSPNTTWYLAEGSTGLDANGNFETWVLLQNPSLTATATATLTYQTPTGTVAGPVVALAPGTRDTVNVANVVPLEWSVSTQVTSDNPIICERAMYWMSAAGVYRQAAHDSIGVNNPGRLWYLAEGSTGLDALGNFETWVLLQNPSTTDIANAQLTFQTPLTSVVGPLVSLAPGTRDTVNVADYVPLEWSVSTQVTSDNPIICERAMYWMSAAGIYRQAAHDSIGFDP